MKEENRGTAMVTPARHREYMRPMLPKKMHTPEAMANPINGAFSYTGRDESGDQPLQCMCIHTWRFSAVRGTRGPANNQSSETDLLPTILCNAKVGSRGRLRAYLATAHVR